jgi:hypothetical protein
LPSLVDAPQNAGRSLTGAAHPRDYKEGLLPPSMASLAERLKK